MAPVTWKVGVYDLLANGKNSTFNGVTNEYLKQATNLKLTYPLNGIDQLNFTLYLDDDAASLITKKQTVIRVWRDINDTANSKTRSSVTATPDFCGLVTGVTKRGADNIMNVVCQSPLWRLQTHFHIANHRLVTDAAALIAPPQFEGGNGDGLPWDHSALMFRLVDMINGAFHATGGDTGIRKPPTRAYNSGTTFWPKTIAVSPFFVQAGAYTWPYINDDLLARAGSPDLAPEYIYVPGSGNFMYFKTAIVRGTDRSASMSFDYRTGVKNLADIEEDGQVVPGDDGYGNFVWSIGDGGPNGGNLGQASDSTDIGANGIYMTRTEVQGAKGSSDMSALATDKLAIALKADAEIYTVTLAEAAPYYYDLDYKLGDQIMLNASRGALNVSNKKQRIYQVELNYSDNNVETAAVQVSADFKRKFP
jgi:hypothetical protein